MYNYNPIMKRIFIGLLIIIMNPLFMSAQKAVGIEASDNWVAINNIKDHLILNKTYSISNPAFNKVKGTPLLFEDFHKGDFYFTNKTYLTDLKINYNCYTNELLYFDENNAYIANSQDIDFFAVTGNDKDSVLLFKQVFLLSEKGRLFMQVLYQRKSTFFKRYKKQFLEADFYKPYGQGRQVDEYNDYYDYYVKPDGREITLLKPKKSSVMGIFSDKSDLIGNYIKKEKINLKDEADLIRLVKYYDSL